MENAITVTFTSEVYSKYLRSNWKKSRMHFFNMELLDHIVQRLMLLVKCRTEYVTCSKVKLLSDVIDCFIPNGIELGYSIFLSKPDPIFMVSPLHMFASQEI